MFSGIGSKNQPTSPNTFSGQVMEIIIKGQHFSIRKIQSFNCRWQRNSDASGCQQ
jgi:hypothetical protein